MNILKPFMGLVILLSFCAGCPRSNDIGATETSPAVSLPKLVKTVVLRERTGKIKFAKELPSIFSETSCDTLGSFEFDDQLVKALEAQLKVLEYKKAYYKRGQSGIAVSNEQLKKTIQILLEKINSGENYLGDQLSAFQSWGKDNKGHVKFTGYYTPVLDIQKHESDKYKFPLYKFPQNWSGRMPTRRQIDGEDALKGRNLEIGYADNLVDIYYMQLQGSGYVNFLDTNEKSLFSYGGKNGHAYRSIEIFMQKNTDLGSQDLTINGIKRYLTENPERGEMVLFYNPSYVFFKPLKSKVKGAGGVKLVENISVAADPKYFPLGSVLLAAVPILDNGGNLSHHKFQILLPQDVGGNIKGAGHVDIYSGVGNEGKKMASARNHYGEVWILLPKEIEHLALN